MTDLVQYGSTIAQDIDVLVSQIWAGAPKAKRQGDLIPLDIAVAVTSIETEDTIDGSSTLTITLVDNTWRLLDSGFFDPDKDGRLDKIDVNYPDGSRFWWRLANADVSSDQNTISLTFMERAVALLMSHKGVKKASRATMTRAQFMKSLVDEVKVVKLSFKCKELDKKQKIAKPEAVLLADTAGPGDFTDQRVAQRKRDDAKKADKDPGLTSGSEIKIKGVTATDDQIDQINRALGQADADDAGPKARKSLVVAGIGESGFQAIPNAKGSNYHGVFQGSKDIFKVDDTEEEAHYFLVGGKGFQAGGAIKLAADNPGMSPGTIATKVEASGESPSFYDVCPPGGNYNAGDEADVILEEYGPGLGSSGKTSSVTTSYRKSFNYSRDKGEDSWDAMTRLAEEVKWPMFADGDRIYFDSDLTLIAQKAAAVINRDDSRVISWNYTVALRKFATDMTITMICDPDEFRAGEVFKLKRFGMASGGKYKGAWLITNIRRNRSEISSTFTLRLPITPSLEPAPEIGSTTTSVTSSSGGTVGNVGDLAYPLAKKGKDLGGPAAHGSRAWGNWQSDNAIDIGVEQGTDVYAVDDGEIVKLGGSWNGGTGNPDGYNITLKTGNNQWFYTHNRWVASLTVGQKVKKGDRLASSGAANGVEHLHIACQTGDPEKLLGWK